MDTTPSTRRETYLHRLDVKERAHELLGAHSHFRGRNRHFEIAYRDGVLIVQGNVPSFYLKQVLQHALKDLEGVRWIDNQVTVISSNGLSDLDGELSP